MAVFSLVWLVRCSVLMLRAVIVIEGSSWRMLGVPEEETVHSRTGPTRGPARMPAVCPARGTTGTVTQQPSPAIQPTNAVLETCTGQRCVD